MTSLLLATTNSQLREPLSAAASLLNEAQHIQGHVSVQYIVVQFYHVLIRMYRYWVFLQARTLAGE